MPLIYSVNYAKCSVGIWQIEEAEDYFLKDLHLYEEEKKELESLSYRKRIQWLSSRHLLHLLTNEEKRLVTSKDNFGKPYLLDSNLHVSLSHSENLVAAIISDFPTGIDVQVKVDKLYRIRNRFLSEKEINEMIDKDDLEQLHIYWGAKECMFKAYGKGKVDFKKHLYVESIGDHKMIAAKFNKPDFEMKYFLKYEIVADFVLVYIIEEHPH